MGLLDLAYQAHLFEGRKGEFLPMKHSLLTAVSLVLFVGAPTLAQTDRSSAGASNPVKLGGDNRNPQKKPAPLPIQDTSPAGPSDVVKTSDTQASNEGKPGSYKLNKKGLIPPPPPGTSIGKDMGDMIAAPKKKKKAPATAQAVKEVTVGQGGPYNFTGKSQEQFSNTFSPPVDPKSKLTFTMNYSPLGGGSPKFNWLRVMIGNRLLATERELAGKTSLVLDMTGSIDQGTNQIVIQGQGSPGATASWKLVTPIMVKLTSANPDEVVVGGDLTLKGENFDPSPSKDIVNIGKKVVGVTSASSTELKLKIPKDFEPGEVNVTVAVEGRTSKPIKITVRGIPELSGTNLQGCPPGAELVIFGKNFSKKIAENQVTFGEQSAQVVSGSTEQLTVVVPNFFADLGGVAGQVGIPIKVKVGKIESKNSVPVNIGNSTWQDPGMKGGPEVPEVPVDWRRLLEN